MLRKPTKTFKMDKQTKRLLCQFTNKHQRADFAASMIDAQLASEVVIKSRADRDAADKTAK
jgi:hypothetical protein